MTITEIELKKLIFHSDRSNERGKSAVIRFMKAEGMPITEIAKYVKRDIPRILELVSEWKEYHIQRCDEKLKIYCNERLIEELILPH